MRLFLGIPLEEPLKTEIEIFLADLNIKFNSIRWTRPSNLHITMRFFGEVGGDDASPLTEWCEETVRGATFGPIRLGKTGIFPHRDKMIFWAGLAESEWIDSLGTRLSAAAGPYPAERRPFRSHLTLGRYQSRQGKDIVLKELFRFYKEARLPECVQEHSRLVLYESRPSSDGAVYREIKSWGHSAILQHRNSNADHVANLQSDPKNLPA